MHTAVSEGSIGQAPGSIGINAAELATPFNGPAGSLSLLGSWRLVAVVLCWFAYLIAVPILWLRFGDATLLLIPLVGVYLCTGLMYYHHELLHNYFPGIHNPTWYNFVSYLLLADPQVSRIAHPSHHRHTHTPDDLEFYCHDWRTNPLRRRFQFIVEMIFGFIAWELCLRIRFFSERLLSRWQSVRTVGFHLLFLGLTCSICEGFRPGAWQAFLANYFLTLWCGAFVARHNDWIEHLGIFSEGSLKERRLLTRNLSTATIAGWLFNLVNHNETATHIIHHSDANHSAAADRVLPAGARTITMSQYAGVLFGYARMI